ncbi:MAG: hypothetical protein M3527_06030 [Actinomycetota bacterium]|nr:hypothetical protein [Acidimicrobiia bacterium]MDQ3293989.1 hypothetical protein [Actinomycetota bacterium]
MLGRRVAVATLLLTACGGTPRADDPGSTAPPATGAPADGTFELPAEAAAGYPEAYIAAVVANPPGDDLAVDGGEYVLIRSNLTIRTDMGGWTVDADGEVLPLGIGRQLDVGAELRLHTGRGTDDADDVFAGLDREVLDDGGLLVLRDSAGAEVARFAYGAAD